MNIKSFIKHVLYPHISVLFILLPVSVAFLVYSLINFKSDSVAAILSYVLSFYTLTVWCVKIPNLFYRVKDFKSRNKYMVIWKNDVKLRVRISLYGSFIWNSAYAVLQLGLGFKHHTAWFFSLAGYYMSLAFMRFFLMFHIGKYDVGENKRAELIKYRTCGIVFLIMNLALSVMMFFMIFLNRGIRHHEITTIALAAYTFTSFTLAVVNTVRYRKYNSPVYSASKIISLAAACVSMMTLEATMLTTFNNDMPQYVRKIFLCFTGVAISAFILVMAIYMIATATAGLRKINNERVINNGE